MSLPRDYITVPSPYLDQEVRQQQWVKIDVRCFDHKDYPWCRACGRRFIRECLFCKHGRR